MLMFVWLCVMTQAFVPGADRALSLQTAAFDAQVRAHFEEPYEAAPRGARRSVAALEKYKNPAALSA